MNKLPAMLDRLQRQEQKLAAAFDEMAHRHSGEYEITRGCILLGGWSKARLSKLEQVRQRSGQSNPLPLPDGTMLSPEQEKGLGLLLDIEQLLSLAHQTQVAWVAVAQAVKTLKNKSLKSSVLSGCNELERAIEWLETQLRNSAPQSILYAK